MGFQPFRKAPARNRLREAGVSGRVSENQFLENTLFQKPPSAGLPETPPFPADPFWKWGCFQLNFRNPCFQKPGNPFPEVLSKF
jgi:hypothetical protein